MKPWEYTIRPIPCSITGESKSLSWEFWLFDSPQVLSLHARISRQRLNMRALILWCLQPHKPAYRCRQSTSVQRSVSALRVRLGQDRLSGVLEARTVRVSVGHPILQRIACQVKFVTSL
jgi:hypothetical protein